MRHNFLIQPSYLIRSLAVCLSTVAIFAGLFFAQNVMAQDAIPNDNTQTAKDFEALSSQQKLKVLNGQMRSFAAELFSDLGPNELEEVYSLRTNYGIVQSVKMVRADLSKAVKSCQDNNDGMESLTKSFEEWKADINPIIEEAENNVILAIEEQKIIDSPKFRAYLERIDKLIEVQEDMIDKQYVTDKEACEKLQNRLDETKEKLSELLKKSIKEI